MKPVQKLEAAILQRVKDIPHVPPKVQRWLGENVWWVVFTVAIFMAIAILYSISAIIVNIAMLNGPSVSYYAVLEVTPLSLFSNSVALFFMCLQVVILAFAIIPLKKEQKKGWVLLFLAWLVTAFSIVVNAILTFTFGSFLLSIIFGLVTLAIIGYFLFELHAYYALPEHHRRIGSTADQA